MKLTQSREDYLEAVYMLTLKNGAVHCADLADFLNVTRPSVSRAVKKLTKTGYLSKEADATLTLTEEGREIAVRVYERHRFFTKLLIEAGVNPGIAEEDACRLEHVVSEETFRILKENVGIHEEPREDPDKLRNP